MKKLLYQLDTDAMPATFDNVVAYDGGADHVTAYGGVTPANVGSLVDGVIFTRAPKDKRYTALFIGGSDLAAGEALLAAVRAKFFAGFKVSVMLDSNGCNTTAAAAVAWLAHGRPLTGQRAVVLAGTGPVGQRAAVMLAREGARVAITGRTRSRVEAVAKAIHERFNVEVEAIEAATDDARANALEGAHVALATGAAGVRLLRESDWAQHRSLTALADANATPTLGIEGIEMNDRGTERRGKVVFGALGFGALKIALHRACIERLFEQNDLVLDAETIHATAKTMVG